MDFKRVHRLSALVVILFIFLHLINHFAVFLGVQKHIELMNVFRQTYRTYFTEILLIGAVAVQIITGFRLWQKLQAVS